MRGIAFLNIAVGVLLVVSIIANFAVSRVLLALLGFAMIAIGVLAMCLRKKIQRNLATTAAAKHLSVARAEREDTLKRLDELALGEL